MILKFVKFLKILQMIILLPVELIWLLVYYTNSQKSKIDMDVDAFAKFQGRSSYPRVLLLLADLMWVSEFRKLFLYRIGDIRVFVKPLMGRGARIGFDVPREKFGGGVYVQHGNETSISAHAIGENFMVNQMVNIGYRGKGYPTIGDNVRVGVGAIVIGDIKIGNNVNIAAGAIVLEDVPDNCTVASPKAEIVKRKEVKN